MAAYGCAAFSNFRIEISNPTKEQAMAYHHTIEKDRCKGCGLCVSVCPKDVLEISSEVNAKGYFPAYQARPEDCIYCTMCCIMCPDVAITITETEESDA
jgi:2-oxoglutarate ferredoxin oxidoreductase subunit delta